MKKKLLLIQPIPTQLRLSPYAILHIIKRDDKGWWCWHGVERKKLRAYKHEGKEVEGRMKLSELARTVKYLELLKWKIMIGEDKWIDKYLLNQFPFGSAFCYLFRDTKTNIRINSRFSTCFCPKKPWVSKNLEKMCLLDNKCSPEGAHVNCILDIDGKHRPISDIISEIESIPIIEIMAFIRKLNISSDKLELLNSLWHIHIWQRITLPHVDRLSSSDFKEGYKN